MKNLYAICTLMLCSFSTLPAQFSLGVSPQYLHALGQLKTEGYRPGVGFNLDVMYGEFGTRLPLVFQLGLQADIGFHGSEVKPIVLLSGESADIRLRNQHVGLLAVCVYFRLMRPSGLMLRG
ncbi:MAG: hypothetical protein D6730_15350 [Bacteroidetes bacterium]|nr:MAG: hypothetical protein D6730_15350 [Bacteroidota bacterium]